MLGCGVFAYGLNKVGAVINDMNKRQTELRHRLALLSAHMRKRGVNK